MNLDKTHITNIFPNLMESIKALDNNKFKLFDLKFKIKFDNKKLISDVTVKINTDKKLDLENEMWNLII